MINRSILSSDEYAPFYAGYVNLVPPDITLRTALDDSAAVLTDYLSNLPEGRENYAYAPDKWTVKEALQHVIDSERIFAYRLLRLGRHDPTPLPGFEQNDYVANMDVSGVAFRRMIEEFHNVRRTTVSLVSGLREQDLAYVGTASGTAISCRAVGFIICGHTYHHERLYRERY